MKKGIAILILSVLLAACGPSQQHPEEREYFEGYDGVEMYFADRDSPPPRLYYYSDTPDNSFDIVVELRNRGSSFARGGLYLSGYDPTLIQVVGINPDLSGFGTCGFSIGNIGFGEFGFGVTCDRISATVGGGGLQLSAQDFGQALQDIFGQTGWDANQVLGGALNSLDFDIDTQGSGTAGGFNFNFAGHNIDFDYASRGRLMISLFSFIDFTRNFGIEYILAGDTPEFPGGDIAVVDWDANIQHFPPGLDETQQTFLITNCYLYTTHAAPLICIDPAPFSEGQKVCRPQVFNPQRGQGAPVAVTRIDQENSPRQAIFTIHVANRGRGEVWDPGMLEKCSPYQQGRVTSADKNKLWLGQIRVSGDPAWLDCIPNDFIRLDRDTRSGSITCRYDIPFQGLKSAYQTPLVVELWYGYEQTIRRTVSIKRAI